MKRTRYPNLMTLTKLQSNLARLMKSKCCLHRTRCKKQISPFVKTKYICCCSEPQARPEIGNFCKGYKPQCLPHISLIEIPLEAMATKLFGKAHKCMEFHGNLVISPTNSAHKKRSNQFCPGI